MNPLFLFPIAFGLLGLEKPRRRSTPGPRGPRITILECEGWDIPAAWWAKVAQPYWDKSLDRLEASWARRPEEPKGIPVEEIARNLLIPELQRNPPTDLGWRCSMPPNTRVQTENPEAPNYWDGPPAILSLLQHITQTIELASTQYFVKGTRRLMP